MKQLLILALFTIINISCERDKTPDPANQKFCWNITSQQQVVTKTVCDKTTAEIAAEYPDGWYYRTDEVLKCYFEINSNIFIKNFPPSLLSKTYPNRTFGEVSCNFCAKWYYREKRRYIPNNTVTYDFTTQKELCGDTLATLYRGREVFLRQTVDSIIVRQFSDNGINW